MRAFGSSPVFRPSLLLAFAAALLISSAIGVAPVAGYAQSLANSGPQEPAAPPKAQGKLVLVLPFENRTGQTGLDWIGDAVPEMLNQRLQSAGFTVIARGDRQYALEHLGLPKDFRPSRATSIRLAQTLDAGYVITGSYEQSGADLKTAAQILDVNALRLDSPIAEQADMRRMLDVLNSLAWRVARALDPAYPVPESSFLTAGASLRLDGFENYIRGLDEPDAAERLRHLKEAVTQNPHYAPAWLALGDEYFGDQQFEQAAAALGHLPKNDPSALRAEFYRGLSFFYTGGYAKAEDAFAYVATQLPLPEVLNNQGVAASRRGRDGAPLFERAINADPHDADYRFNLAVALARKHDFPRAKNALQEALKLRPADSEAEAFAAALRAEPADAGPQAPAASEDDPASRTLPLERIKRNFNDASFRQAAAEMEAMEAMRIASLPPAERGLALTREGERFLRQGLLLEAEREFEMALAADARNAAAHAGLAEVRQRDGDSDAARQEARASLALEPNAPAYVVLGKLDLAAHQLAPAAAEADQALRLDPANGAARSLKQTLEAKAQPAPQAKSQPAP